MFDFVRNNQRLMQFLLLLFIFPSFALFGVERYMQSRDGDNAIAKVAGQPITQQEFDAALREQMDRMRQMFGAQFDPKMFDTPDARKNILDNLIAERVLAYEANRDHLAVPDRALQQTILAIPGLTNEAGKFDGERYKALLAMQGMTPAMYEARLRKDMALQQLNASIQATAFAPKTIASRLSDLSDQERVVQEMLFKPADYVSQVKVTDDMLKSYYEQHIAEFTAPEHAKIEYAVLNLDALASKIPVSDADVKAYYEQNLKKYKTDEQRRASHILIAVKKDAPEAEKAAAKAKAEKILEEVRKNPADFAKLAKEYSQDPGSAQQGGDLGYFSRGMMVKPFDDAVFNMKEGQISDLVPSDYGYHIIELTGIKPGATKSLDEVKGDIVADIQKQQALKKFADAAETFSNAVYEQADTLKTAADKLNLNIQTASDVTRTPNPSVAPTAPYNNPKFLKALFSDDVLKNKHNTEAIEVAPNTLIAGRIVDYKPAARKPFDEVKDAVRERVTQEQAEKLATKAGEAKLAEVRGKDDAAGFGAEETVSRAKPNDLGAPALAAVMKADASKLPAYVGTDLGDKGYGVFRIVKVVQPAPDAARRQAEQQQIAQALAQQEMLGFLDVLKQKAKVKVLKPVGALKSADDDSQSDTK